MLTDAYGCSWMLTSAHGCSTLTARHFDRTYSCSNLGCVSNSCPIVFFILFSLNFILFALNLFLCFRISFCVFIFFAFDFVFVFSIFVCVCFEI